MYGVVVFSSIFGDTKYIGIDSTYSDTFVGYNEIQSTNPKPKDIYSAVEISSRIKTKRLSHQPVTFGHRLSLLCVARKMLKDNKLPKMKKETQHINFQK